MVKLLLQKMLRDMKKSMAAYGICLLIVAVGFCGYCLMSVAEDHLIASRDLLYERSSFAEVQEAPAAITDKLKKSVEFFADEVRFWPISRMKACCGAGKQELGQGYFHIDPRIEFVL